ncbi:hypothetical protein F2Q69_00057810 [Brassica cretica]|uniref:Uncharacterized protein n=1 Tax=Brassica cretica TaxID=69181 RepID=A0A8S9MZC0_BRACR|nr:hypothetical protein F2Q69_00057810 [Brassica cretica]
MDKKKNRADPLAAGRQKLQQFRQKKADKNTDHKKDPKGSTSKGKSSKKSGKSEKHDKSAVTDGAEAPSAGGATSHVNIVDEVVDSPQTSADALSHEYVLVHGSSSEPDTLQTGNTTATSDSGAELGKDTGISLSTVDENMKSIDRTAAGAVDSVTSERADSEKGVTHDDASISVDGVFTASGNLAKGEGVEVESGDLEKPHQPSSSPEFIPDVSLSGARGDQVTDVGEMQEDRDSQKEQFSEASAKADVDWIVTEERQASYPAVVDSSASPSHFSEGPSVAIDSVELEGTTGEIRSQLIREAAELSEEKPESSIACSSVLAEIESRKAELVGNDNFNMSLHQEADDFSSMESVRSMVNRLSSAVKEFVVANAETVERNEKEMKVMIANLQRELHEKDIQNDRMCSELVGQVKEAQAGAKIFAEDLQSASARMRDMQDQRSILVRERDFLKERVKDLQEGQASHSESQEKVTSLSNLLAAKDQEIEALMQALDEEESQMEDLKHRVTELEQELQQKNLDLQKAEASRGKISKKLSITVDKFDELHHLSENLLAEIEKLQKQVQDRDTEVSFLRQEVTRCTNEALAASQMDTKRDSEEIQTVLSWFETIASLLGLEDSPSADAQSHLNRYMETLKKNIASILSETEELRRVGQSKDSLLEAERSRVAELRQKEATLEKLLHDKESQPSSSTSEIVEVEPLV